MKLRVGNCQGKTSKNDNKKMSIGFGLGSKPKIHSHKTIMSV
jgi:hypothetical protein